MYDEEYRGTRRRRTTGPLVPPPPPGWKPEEEEPRRVVPWKKIFLWMGISIVGMFLLILLGDKVIMPWYVNAGAEAVVPDVVGMPFSSAEELLIEKEFEVLRDQPRFSDEVPAGVVLMQLPYGGATTKKGRRIYLTESRGVELIPMPALIGRPLREARITLMRQGFEVGEIEYDFNDTIMRDLVFAQSVPADVGTRPGTKISLMLSKGPSTRYSMMPNLVGLSLDEARARLASAGLTLGVVRKRRSSFERNVVVDQSASPYAQVSERAAINVTISDPNAPLEEGSSEDDQASDDGDAQDPREKEESDGGD